jgi:integrase
MLEAAPKHPYVLFQRTEGGPWWVRFSIRGEGQIRKRLGTSERYEAERLALEVWSDARHRNRIGLRCQIKSFSDVATEFITLVKREAERGERRPFQAYQFEHIIQRYYIGYFGDRDMDAIRTADIMRYWEWRRDYWLTGPGFAVKRIFYMRNGRQIGKDITAAMRKSPSPGSQRAEAVVLRMLFKFAAKLGYIQDAHLPDVDVPRVLPNARPSFEASEFTKLEQMSQLRLSDFELNEHVRRDRAILHAYIMIAAYTGMRPTELKNLNWGDVLGYRETKDKQIGLRDIRIQCRGKGKARRFVPLKAAVPWFDILWMFWTKAMKADPADADPVFATPTGKRLCSVKKSLSELLKAAGLLTDHRGTRRTSYSFRHFYISQQLIAGVNVFLLAKNTGTSADMIDRFYADVKLERMHKELRPEWHDRTLSLEESGG